MANYEFSVGHPTDVGSYPYPSPYGTFDQGGNCSEWNETLMGGSSRCVRGGSFPSTYDGLLSSFRGGDDVSFESWGIAFRVVETPEPATLSMLALGGLAILRRRRKA